MVSAKRYPFAERFQAPQGEGHYTGTVFAFARLVGCSVGQKVCTHCDTEFNLMRDALGQKGACAGNGAAKRCPWFVSCPQRHAQRRRHPLPKRRR